MRPAQLFPCHPVIPGFTLNLNLSSLLRLNLHLLLLTPTLFLILLLPLPLLSLLLQPVRLCFISSEIGSLGLEPSLRIVTQQGEGKPTTHRIIDGRLPPPQASAEKLEAFLYTAVAVVVRLAALGLLVVNTLVGETTFVDGQGLVEDVVRGGFEVVGLKAAVFAGDALVGCAGTAVERVADVDD